MATDTLEIFGTEYTGVTGIKATDSNSGTKTYIRPQGTKSITQNGTGIDVAEYASVDVSVSGGSPTIQSLTVTPSTSQQTFNASGVDGYKPVTVNAMPTGSLVGSGTYSITNPTIDVGETGLIAVTGESQQIVNPVYTSGYIDTSATQYVTATVYGTYQLPSADPYVGFMNNHFYTENNQRKWSVTAFAEVDEGEGDVAGWLPQNFRETRDYAVQAVSANTTVTPTKSAQTIGGANYMMEGAVTVNPIPSQYIVPSGTLSVSDNGTTDCTNYANVTVSIPFVTYYTGSSAPSSSLGSDGDIYLKTV